MMKFLSLLRRESGKDCPSVRWHSSKAIPGVRFAVRRVSLQQRIELNRRLRELTMQYEFLKTGDPSSQLEAAMSDLLVAKLYIEWGLAEIDGLSIDGEEATPTSLIVSGPEDLTDEIVQEVQAESILSQAERKNS